MWTDMYSRAYLQAWLGAFALTLAIEVPVYLSCSALLGWWGRADLLAPEGGERPAPPGSTTPLLPTSTRRLGTAVYWSVLVNLTHPLLWAWRPSTLSRLVVAETLIAAVEGVLWLWAWRRQGITGRQGLIAGSLLTGVLANVLSWLTGWLLAL